MATNPIAAMILAKKAPVEAPDDGDPKAGGEDDEGLNAAAGDILAAIDSKDQKMLVTALKSFCEMC